MADHPAPTEPHAPQGKAGVAAWFFRFFERVAESKNASAFVALTLTAWIMFLSGYSLLELRSTRLEIQERFTESLGQILAHQNQSREYQLKFEAQENERDRAHDAMERERDRHVIKTSVDALVRSDKDLTKSIATLYFEFQALKKALASAFPGKILTDLLPDIFGRREVAPMPTELSSCTDRSGDTTLRQPLELGGR